ncbi:MAG: RNA polymerase sigma factor [Thermomonas haemolytica]
MMGVILRHPATGHAMSRPAEPAIANEGNDAWGAWMARAQGGDKQAYHALLQAVEPYLRAIARRMLGHEDAEDAVQEILLIVHGIRHTYQPGRPFKPWLSTIATRRCVDLLRRRQREGARVGEAIAAETFVDAGPEPADALARAQRDAQVRRAVSALSPGQRDAVRLLHLQGLSLREAERQGRQSAGALKVASHRALKALRRALQGEQQDAT